MGDAAPSHKDPGAHGPKPTIGRIVHVYGEKGGPYAAIITELAPDQTTMIGVTIFLPGGEVRGVANFDARGAGAGSFGSFVQEGGKLYNVWTWVWPPRD